MVIKDERSSLREGGKSPRKARVMGVHLSLGSRRGNAQRLLDPPFTALFYQLNLQMAITFDPSFGFLSCIYLWKILFE